MPQELEPVERWFVSRGVPHFIEDYDASTDIWTRAAPLLLIAYVAGGFNALDLANWSWQRNVLVALGVVAMLVATFCIANWLRDRPLFSRPAEIGNVELALVVLGPALPPLVLGQVGDAIQSVLEGIAVLGLIYLGTSYGLVPLLHWAGFRTLAQLPLLAGLVLRVLPLVLLFTAFVFISTEAWQVAGTLTGLPYVAVLVMFFLLGALFVLSRLPREMRGLATFDSWAEVRTALGDCPIEPTAVPAEGEPPAAALGRRQQFNVALVQLFPQALQITFVTVLLTGFFVLFGFLAITEETIASWTQEEVRVFLSWRVSGRDLVLTEPLLRVAGFLGAFTGMYFTVVLATDATYRDEFAEDVRPEVRQAFAVRLAYRHLRTAGGQPSPASTGGDPPAA
jgi:hypothetical protein